MASELLSYAGWTFLPGLVSGWIQTVYYGITIRAGDPKPQPGSPRYLKHRRIIQSTVILAYLLYTIYEADYWVRQNADFYQILGLPLDADEKRIKSRFRRLAALYHPDKLTDTSDPALLAAAESHFVLLKDAQDTLTDPARRFAYERYGPDILNWQHCVTIRDYLAAGTLQVQAPLYGGALTFLGLLSFTSYLQAGRFWRYLFSFALLVLECHTISRPYMGPVLTRLVNPMLGAVTRHPPLLPFQLLVLARKATFTVFIAISQLSGLFPSSTPPAAGAAVRSPEEMQQLARLEQLAQATDAEAGRLLQMDMSPFVGDAEGTRELRGKVREWLVTNTIRADPEVRDAMGKVLGRRRAGAPAGARG